MQSTTLIILLGFMVVTAFYLGRERSLSFVGGHGHGMALHSLPGYYGYFVAIWVALPALGLLLLWVMVEPRIVVLLVINGLPDAYQALPAGELNLLVNNIQNLAAGDVVGVDVDDVLQDAAAQFNGYTANSRQILAVLAIGLAGLGGATAWRRIRPDLSARNRV
jgi:phosphate transport system permease protein